RGECSRLHRRLQWLEEARDRSGRAREPAVGRLFVPDRAQVPGVSPRLQDRGVPDRLRRPQGRQIEDEQEDRLRGFASGLGIPIPLAVPPSGIAGTALPLIHFRLMRLTFAAAVCALLACAARASSFVPTAILVDKKTNQLSLAHYRNGAYELIKTFHAT